MNALHIPMVWRWPGFSPHFSCHVGNVHPSLGRARLATYLGSSRELQALQESHSPPSPSQLQHQCSPKDVFMQGARKPHSPSTCTCTQLLALLSSSKKSREKSSRAAQKRSGQFLSFPLISSGRRSWRG